MSEPLLTGKVSFIQHHLPALEAGEYRLVVEQEVSIAGAAPSADHFVSQTKFAIAGNRFQLDDSEIDSMFPPPNSQGEFENVLPHLVLKRRTFPWERAPWRHAGAHTRNSSDDVPTWLALLLFDADDGVAPALNVTVADLAHKLPAHILSYPDLASLDYGEDYAHPCRAVDIPLVLFNAIAPTLDDLKWLAHARRVDMTKKALSEVAIAGPAAMARLATNGAAAAQEQANGGEPETSDYAVVVGNRLPVPGRKSTVHLVSLDRMGEYLPDAEGRQNPSIPAGTQYVRLVSLRSWSFDTVDEKQSFQAILETVNLLSLRRPAAGLGSANKAADSVAANALAMGFTALNHRPRHGGRTVSWYRGPLVPFPVVRRVETPIENADAVTQFDPTTGLLDVSYAAAWQLGRLMALQNQEFATALFTWKLATKRASIDAAEQALLHRRIGADPDMPVEAASPAHDAALDLLKSSLDSLAASPPAKKSQ